MEIIFILILLALAIAAEYMAYSVNGAKRLAYKAGLRKSEVFEGENAVLIEEIDNGKRLPLPFVKTEILAPAFLDFGVKAEANKEGICGIPSVFSLKGREKCVRVRNIKCTCRGVFEIGAASLYGSDLFGLCGFSLKVKDQVANLTVLPSPLEAEDFLPDNRQLYGDISVRRFICEDPFLISGAREYSGREPMNSISWSATARAGKLMALNKDHTTSAKILILLNFQRRDDIFAAAPMEICELLIKAAAFVMERAEEIGAEFALSINAVGEPVVFSGSGAEFKLEQLRRLAAVVPECRLRIGEFLTELSPSGYTDVILITPALSEESVRYLEELKTRGTGVYAYAMRNEAEAEFCSQIIRKADGKKQ